MTCERDAHDSSIQSGAGLGKKRRPERREQRASRSKPDDSRPAKGDEKEPPGVAGLRVIGGSLRRSKLAYSGDVRTRPMKERVREAVFNLVGTQVAGTFVVDLFAGTGALGIEALSRGAVQGMFLEKHFPTADLIRENLRALGLETRGTVTAGDTFLQVRMLRRDGRTLAPPPADPSAPPTPWTVFCSPPYEFYASREQDLLQLLDDLRAMAPPRSLFVVEYDKQFDAAKLPEPDEWDVRDYTPAIVAVRRFD